MKSPSTAMFVVLILGCNMGMLAVTEKFFARHLSGSFQESVPPDVAKRLTEITVDPKR